MRNDAELAQLRPDTRPSWTSKRHDLRTVENQRVDLLSFSEDINRDADNIRQHDCADNLQRK